MPRNPFRRKPTLADIYVDRLRSVDDSWVPIYTPWTPNVRVGTVGRFHHGEFEVRGHLESVLEGAEDFRARVPLAEPSAPIQRTVGAEQGARLEPMGSIQLAGEELLTARLTIDGDRVVVASFVDVVLRAVLVPRDFDDLLWELYLTGALDRDEVVVSAHQGARSGTVIINRRGSLELELMASPGLVGGVLSLESLGAGVKFGAASKASVQESGGAMTYAVQVKGLDRDWQDIVARRSFDAADQVDFDGVLGSDLPFVGTADVLGAVAWDEADEST